jgi:hypothetical protein
MPLSPTMQEFRAQVEALALECQRTGSMDAIHYAARDLFRADQAADVYGRELSRRDCFALGEVYQCASVESALFILDELGAE